MTVPFISVDNELFITSRTDEIDVTLKLTLRISTFTGGINLKVTLLLRCEVLSSNPCACHCFRGIMEILSIL